MTISVIVPVYNALRHINACVEGLLKQTYPPDEIILVDDGSTDGSGERCDFFAKSDDRIKVIHTKNGGAACARNTGLNNAQGDYIVFVDADDRIPEDHLQVLVETLEKYGADMVVGAVTYVPGPTVSCKECVCNTWEFIEKVLYRDGAADYPISKLYRREMFEGIRFKEGITSEDFEIFYRLYQRAKRIAMTDQTTYYYIQTPGSVTGSGFSEKFFNRIEICEELVRNIERDKPELLPAAYSRLVDEMIWLYGITPKTFKKERGQMLSAIRGHKDTVLRNQKITPKTKRKIRLFSIHPLLWRGRMVLKSLVINLYSNFARKGKIDS